MAKIIAVCKRKAQKGNCSRGCPWEDYGLIGDTHADCCTHRQVSLLAIESINKRRGKGLDVDPEILLKTLLLRE